MASEKQIAANRRNARKSTGPRTARGKARSSKNALTRGLSRQNLIPGEDFREYKAHFASIEAEFQPTSFIEETLVRMIADAMWRMRRLNRMENAYLAAVVESEKRKSGRAETGDHELSSEDDAHLYAAVMGREIKALIRFEKNREHLSKMRHEAVMQLDRMRRAERKPLVPKPRAPRTDAATFAFRA